MKLFKNIIIRILIYPIVRKILRTLASRILLFYKFHFYEQPHEQFIKNAPKIKNVTLEELDIKENFTDDDAKALKSLLKMVKKNEMLIVEVGSWKGYSTAILAEEMSNCNGQVFAIDHWKGTPGVWNWEVTKNEDIYLIFRRNMILLGFWDKIVYPLVMDSYLASKIFADEILDFIFLDGDHRYTFFKKDILSWLPKLKEGGILCGHDCEGYYSDYPEGIQKKIDEHLEEDYIPELCHPGIVKVLYEIFGKNYSIMRPNSVVWYYVKKK